MKIPFLFFLAACSPPETGGLDTGDDPSDGGQSGATTESCGTETRTPVDDLAVAAPGVSFAAQGVIDANVGLWEGAMLDSGELIAIDVQFGDTATWVYQETCGGWYEIDATLSFESATLSGDFSGIDRNSSDRAAFELSALSGAYTTTLAPTAFEPADYASVWLELRAYIDGDRLYGVPIWRAGDGTPPAPAGPTSTPTVTTGDGIAEEIGWFEAFRP